MTNRTLKVSKLKLFLKYLMFACPFIWSDKCPWVLKILTQPTWVHLNGFSPVCIRMWIFKFPFSLKSFPHVWHLKGLSWVYGNFNMIVHECANGFLILKYLNKIFHNLSHHTSVASFLDGTFYDISNFLLY
jgi:hypothetical protein